jgi:hypothetical protein
MLRTRFTLTSHDAPKARQDRPGGPYAFRMAIDIAHTRTSARWASRPPGNIDRLNTRALLPADNDLGIPKLRGCQVIPDTLVAWSSRASAIGRGAMAWHFFLDDYRFENVWNRSQWGITRAGLLGGVLSPDFSLWPQMPRVMQQWQVYRSRWVGALWEANGIKVIPTVSWSDRDSHGFAFLGLPIGGTIAVSTVGLVRQRERHPAFLAGYEAMFDACRPTTVLCYGRVIDGMTGDIREYPTRWRS